MPESGHGQVAHEESCYLGILAPELLDNILFEIDSVRALGNFIATSRFIYRRFEQQREATVFSVLKNELGPVLTDARFLRVFPYADPGHDPEGRPDYWDGIHTMAVVYINMLAGRERAATAFPSSEELTELCHTLYNVNFLTQAYITSRQRWFSSDGPAGAPPSRTERLRVMRAIYRRQIICNAWAPTRRRPAFRDEDVVAMSNTSEHQGGRLGLLAAFEAWELEQVDHIDHFITQLCSAIVIAREEEAERPINEVQFGELFAHLDCLVHYMKEHQGLVTRVLDTLPRESTTRPRRGDDIEDGPPELTFTYRFSMLCFRHAWQMYRFENFPDPVRDRRHLQSADHEEGSDRDLTVSFMGDRVDSVPFAWVDALKGRNVNWFGEALNPIYGAPRPENEEEADALFSPLGVWCRAGMTLWDRKRVEALKELHFLSNLHTGWVVF